LGKLRLTGGFFGTLLTSIFFIIARHYKKGEKARKERLFAAFFHVDSGHGAKNYTLAMNGLQNIFDKNAVISKKLRNIAI